ARPSARLPQLASRAVPGPGNSPRPRCERKHRYEQQRSNGERAPAPGGSDRSANGRGAHWRGLLGRGARQGHDPPRRPVPLGGRSIRGRVRRLRSATGLLLAALLALVGLLAYVLGLLIARPLGRLTTAAAKIAAGDLLVELPVGGVGEVGYLTRVFNTLVGRLRERESQ